MAAKFPETEKFIRTYGSQVEQEIETRLHNSGRVASGKLYDSIRYEVKREKQDFILSFKMADYGKYIDKGVRGAEKNRAGKSPYKFTTKMPPIKPIMKWMKLKGIDKSKAWAVRRSIYLFGITPTNFFTIPTTRRAKQFEQGYIKAMGRDLDNMITDLNK
jgi:hypothetical protein